MKKTLFANRGVHYVFVMMKYSTLVYIAICCLCSFSWASNSYGQNVLDKRLTIDIKNEAFPAVLEKISSQAAVEFAYTDYIINNASPVTLRLRDEPLRTVLDKLLSPINLTFTLVENTIVLKKSPNTQLRVKLERYAAATRIAPLFSLMGQGAPPLSIQQLNVSGTVTDGMGHPLPGVSVILKGSLTGTVTDEAGNYHIQQVAGSDVLVFSLLGYLGKEIPVSGRSEINVSLDPDIASLEEVIVVGYGSQKKQDITGAISSISGKALKEVPVTNVQQMLQGRASGVYVVQSNNKPGAGAAVQIRGRRSFSAGNDPLYVIDGIPITGGFNDINPNDIASIEILKDASATAIYGSRGANGVVLVTTKRGAPGQTIVSYNNYLGVSSIFRHANMMTGEEFAAYRREAARNSGHYDDSKVEESEEFLFEDVERNSLAEGYYTNWPELLIRNGFTQNHDLSVAGGSEKTLLNLSLGYLRDKGIIPGQDYTRYTARVNIDQTIGRRFKAGVSMLGSYSLQNGANTNPYSLALLLNPLGKPYDENGNLIFKPTSEPSWSNVLAETVPGAVINENRRYRLFTSLYGEAEITNGLTFKLNFGPDLIQGRRGDFHGSQTLARLGGDPTAAVTEDFVFNYTLENILTFNKELDAHSLGLTGLYSIQTRSQQTSAASVQGLPVESLEFYNLGSAEIINSVSSSYSKWAILSYMARINYAYNQRFLLTLTGRFDGSSRFAPGNQWGFFPSVAVGWNLINEDFIKGSNTISNLKLRLSYGETGNTGIAPYQTQGLLSRTSYDFAGAPAYGYRPGSIRNDELRWETTASANLGIDFSLWNNRLNGSVELYRSKTTDLLLPRVLPITSGFGSVLENVGSTRNTGLEFTFSTQNIVAKNEGGFEWSTDINLSTNKEEILELSQGKVDDIGNARFIGQPITVYYDYEKIGIWQLGQEAEANQFSSEVGQIKINDRNKNGVIDPEDRTILGTNVPKLSGGITNRVSWKGFDLSVFVFARFGNMIQSSFHQGAIFQLAGRYNNYRVDYWTESNPTNNYPRPNLAQERPLFSSTLTYFDGSFIKVRNINLGYNFPGELASKVKARSLRLYASVQNPFIFAPYIQRHNGIDPESPVTDTPLSRLFMMGVNVSF